MSTRVDDHPLVGTAHTYRPWAEPYDPDADRSGGVLVVGNGMRVRIRAVFRDFNDVPGLTMLYVGVPATAMTTHVTPADLGLEGRV